MKRPGWFGSFVRGEQGSQSAVDLLIEFRQGERTFDPFMELSFLLEDLLRRPVEPVTPEGLSPKIGPHILEQVQDVPLAA